MKSRSCHDPKLGRPGSRGVGRSRFEFAYRWIRSDTFGRGGGGGRGVWVGPLGGGVLAGPPADGDVTGRVRGEGEDSYRK